MPSPHSSPSVPRGVRRKCNEMATTYLKVGPFSAVDKPEHKACTIPADPGPLLSSLRDTFVTWWPAPGPVKCGSEPPRSRPVLRGLKTRSPSDLGVREQMVATWRSGFVERRLDVLIDEPLDRRDLMIDEIS